MKKIITFAIIAAMVFAVGLYAERADGGFSLDKTAMPSAGQVTRSMSNISNWGYWVYYNGKSAQQPNGSSGGIYPRGTAGAIFQDGFVWGGYLDTTGNGIGDEIRVGGQTYNIGTQPGWVITGGDISDAVLADPADPAVRIYRIRPDYENLTHATLLQDAAELNETDVSSVTTAMTQELIDQYELDWEEWPVEHGAPYYDNDNDGVYTAGVDEPGIALADQVIWYAVNDYNRTSTMGLYGSLPIGVELQTTLWAYNQSGARLGQIIFKKNLLINKSGKTVTDMYVSQWADPDLGSASNDYAGCDTVLSLGYAYNGESTDADYNYYDLAPPAFGYDFFQGPIIESAGDTAIFDLEYRDGYKNMGMTSFGWFAAGSAIEDPELGKYQGTLEFYNLMRGYLPTEDIANPTEWHLGNENANPTTKYPLSGDPVAGTGDLDGHDSYFAPGDRRICLSSGPFTFAPGDSQEVVVAVLGGLGKDNIGSVADLKLTDAVAQQLFDGLFQAVPKPPVSPNVTARPFEEEIILEWGSDTAAVAATEDPVVSGYSFEGYNVYQLPSATATIAQAKRIATYDRINGIKLIYEKRYPDLYEGQEVNVPIAYGSDNGVQRYIHIDKDYINDAPLNEGSTYYFAVTAYNQNSDEGRLSEAAMESPLVALPVVVQEPLPGIADSSAVLGDFPVEHSAGPSDGQVSVTVVDPRAVTGDSYEITFDTLNGETLWNLENTSTGITLLEHRPQFTTLDASDDSYIIDGLQIKVSGPPLGLKSVKEYDAASGDLLDGGVSIVEFSLGSTGYILSTPSGEYNQDPYTHDFDRFNLWGMDDFEIDMSDSSVAWQYWTEECMTEYVPFALYRHNFATGEKERLYIAIYDDNFGDTDASDGYGVWDTTGYDALFHKPAWEPVMGFVGPTPYDPAQEAAYLSANALSSPPSSTGWDSGYPVFGSAVFVDYLGYGLPIGSSIMFTTNKPNTLDDVFTFSTVAGDSSDAIAAEAVEKVNVYPNPYYAYNSQSTSPYDQYVTFTHLPSKATIKIYNLAGVLIKEIEHENASSQFCKWDLTNASNIPVGSGMYIAHINMPDLDKQKILKFMVIQNKQILEYY